MFKFWKKRGSSGSRRTTRMWFARAKKYVVTVTMIAAIGGGGFYAWKSGAFTAFGDWAVEKSMVATSAMGFKVDDILITGRHRISQKDLMEHLKIAQGAPILGIDLLAAQQSLSQISWVEQASVSRRLPSTIVIDIRERAPVALWQFRQKISVIDANGQPLTSDNVAEWQDLPLIVGEDAPRHVTEILSLMNAEPDIAQQLVSAVRVGDRRWDLRLKNGMLVKLPEQNVEFALRQFAKQQEENNILDKQVVTIDLRIPEKFVVEMKPLEATPDKPKT